jgi:hypothetical protein
MIGKLSVLGFSLVTAIASPALAHGPHESRQQHHQGSRNDDGRDYGGSYGPASREVDLRRADHNRDGWVTLQEALDSGRQVFRQQDRDRNSVLTRYELNRPALRQDDRNNDGRVSMREYQRSVRAHFASLDSNRDGYLGSRELGVAQPRGMRPAGWRR